MLFLGLCNQVNEADYLLNDEQLIAQPGTNNLLVVIAIIALIFFGFAFFVSWFNSSKVRIMRYSA
jgi:preprotein translocase subunit SecG